MEACGVKNRDTKSNCGLADVLVTITPRIGTIINRLKLGPASGDQLRQLVIDKLPNVLTAKEKETKVKNLRTALRLRGLEGTFIEVAPAGPARGSGAMWRIKT